MFTVPLVTSSEIIPREKFWNAIMVYHNRPHLINRRITAVSQVLFHEIGFHSCVKLQELINRSNILYELRKLEEINVNLITEGFLKELIGPYDKNIEIKKKTLEEFNRADTGVFVSVRILYPRLKNCPKAIEVIIIDKASTKITFLSVTDSESSIAPVFPYEIELTQSSILKINLQSFEDADTAQAEWLAEKLFTKLLKWAECLDETKDNVKSLSLVNVDEYCLTYSALKQKYGTKLVQEWPKRCRTVAQKYVFEDIAIASYLVCLWKEKNIVKFIDCGCGNGLLVYLLNEEGYEGYGLDIRKRSIWDFYPETIKLQLKPVTPSSVFPDATWIIGNHSDELTPWIPVIALKSSPQTNFFVLPCCPYDFNGEKFIRVDSSISAYSDYLKYIEDISVRCGFNVNIDKLRIPSTRRTCIIGWRQNLNDNKHKEILSSMEIYLGKKIPNQVSQRQATERVRNCTQLDKSLISNIIEACLKKLLLTDNWIVKSNGDKWNKGGSFPLQELVKTVPSENLKQLKNECGGLQTLLRNHRYIFQLENGLVSLRKPLNINESSKYKEKACWFIKNHPDGCLYDIVECGYSHK